MTDGVSTAPPQTDEFVWYREDRVATVLRQALKEAIEIHGDPAKAFAWDVANFFPEIMHGR